jgi:hypothetical protein
MFVNKILPKYIRVRSYFEEFIVEKHNDVIKKLFW